MGFFDRPSAREVIDHAVAAVQAAGGTIQVKREGASALALQVGDRSVVWNLADVIRLAPKDARWREGLSSLAQQVAAQLVEAPAAQAVPLSEENVVALVWPERKLEAVGLDVVHEVLVPGLVVFYGVRHDGRIRSISRDELEASGFDLPTLRDHGLLNVGATLDGLDVGSLQEGTTIFTNHAGSPCAASLLANLGPWRGLCRDFGPMIAAVPAPSRLFFAPDTADNRLALTMLTKRSLEIEPETLSSELLRFDGEGWSVVTQAN